jgi:hypothetical protein
MIDRWNGLLPAHDDARVARHAPVDRRSESTRTRNRCRFHVIIVLQAEMMVAGKSWEEALAILTSIDPVYAAALQRYVYSREIHVPSRVP